MATRLRRAGRIIGYTAGAGAVAGGITFGYLYTTQPGVRRSVRFWQRTAPVVAQYWWARRFAADDADRDARYEQLNERHSVTAREVIEELRGMFVKVAQVMSVRPEVVPEAYRREFRKLQAEAPAERWEPVKATLERELGALLEDVFEDVDRHPLGAASIGQAHLVRWRGRQAVVKVQYPDAESVVRADFWCLRTLLWMVRKEALPMVDQVQKQFEVELDFEQEAVHLRELHNSISAAPQFAGKVVVPAPIPELTRGRVIGMDYLPGPKLETALRARLEALGLDPSKARFGEWLGAGDQGPHPPSDGSEDSGDPPPSSVAPATPGVQDDRGAGTAPQRVGPDMQSGGLVAGFGRFLLRLIGIDAALWLLRLAADLRLWVSRHFGSETALDSKDAGPTSLAELRAVLHTVLDVHGYQIFFCPYFNADPHPGNVLLLPDGRVGLIDFGQCRSLSEEEKTGLAELILALDEPRSPEADARVARAFASTGIRSEKGDEVFNSFLPRLMFCRIEADWLTPGVLRDIFQRDRVNHWPVHMVMAYRTAMLLRGLCLSLQENVSVAENWRPWAERWLQEARSRADAAERRQAAAAVAAVAV